MKDRQLRSYLEHMKIDQELTDYEKPDEITVMRTENEQLKAHVAELTPAVWMDVHKFVTEWLWNGQNRSTDQQSWPDEYVRDAAKIAAEFYNTRLKALQKKSNK